MGYGAPPSLDEAAVFTYLKHVHTSYGAPDPAPEEVAESIRRQRLTGGPTVYPLTERLVAALQHALDLSFPSCYRVYRAFKHSPPLIADAVRQMAADGIRRAVAVTRAPFASRMTTESYYQKVREAGDCLAQPMVWGFAENWHLHPLFLRLWQSRIDDALRAMPKETQVIFTNHSLPARIREWDDPYPAQFEQTAEKLARECSLTSWRIAYQSGSAHGEWLGPDVLSVVRELAARGARALLLVPIGFTLNNVEVRWDIDIQVIQELGTELGIRARRPVMLNDDPLFVALLVDIVRACARADGVQFSPD